MFDLTVCHDRRSETTCGGPLELTVSASGVTRVMRCTAHAADYRARMSALEDRLARDFPGWDTPGSPPPRWFDASYAGESWDED